MTDIALEVLAEHEAELAAETVLSAELAKTDEAPVVIQTQEQIGDETVIA